MAEPHAPLSQLEALLVTKLTPPPLRSAQVQRARLVAQVRAGLARPLTLVLAPAGFGKTTLLATALHQHNAAVAWVSLDERDNDPARFWAYVLAALDAALPGAAARALGLLYDMPSRTIETVLDLLVNDLVAASGVAVLALDDYHLITQPQIHAALSYLLDFLPPTLRLVIASRTEPPLPLARLRVRRQLTELGIADLRFTDSEATELLNHLMGLNLSTDSVVTLSQRTEGWGAGLLLAALSLQGRRDTETFIATFSGSQRDVLDYVLTEVLQRQPETVQHFLLCTAILDRLNGPLCDAVLADQTGSATPTAPNSTRPSALVLEELERTNLLLIPLDEQRHWYRYHHLFADALRARLARVDSTRIPELHRRAAHWYSANNLLSEAVDHAIAAQDWGCAADAIAALARPMLMHSELVTLQRWLSALPSAFLLTRPDLRLVKGWMLVLLGDLYAAERLLHELSSTLADQTEAIALEWNLDDEWRVLYMIIGALRGQMQHTMLTHELLARLPQHVFLHNIVLLSSAFQAMFEADLQEVRRLFQETIQFAQANNNTLIALVALCQLGELEMTQGHLRRANQLYHQALQLVETGSGRAPSVIGLAYLGLGELARERGDFTTGIRYLEEGLMLCADVVEIGRFDGYVSLARIRAAQNDHAAAQAALQQAHLVAQRLDVHLAEQAVALHIIRLALRNGQVSTAQQLLASHAVFRTPPAIATSLQAHLFHSAQLLHTRLLIVQDAYAAAVSSIDAHLDQIEQSGWVQLVIENLIVRMHAHTGLGAIKAARADLERALMLAEPEGYIRMFVDEGEPMRTQLRAYRPWLATHPDPHLDRSRLLAYVDRLLVAFDSDSRPFLPNTPESDTLPEPLSTREHEVLRLIAAGLSNQEIADQLVVAHSTVKKHINSIFAKLAVTTRTRAIVRARELKLLG